MKYQLQGGRTVFYYLFYIFSVFFPKPGLRKGSGRYKLCLSGFLTRENDVNSLELSATSIVSLVHKQLRSMLLFDSVFQSSSFFAWGACHMLPRQGRLRWHQVETLCRDFPGGCNSSESLLPIQVTTVAYCYPEKHRNRSPISDKIKWDTLPYVRGKAVSSPFPPF